MRKLLLIVILLGACTYTPQEQDNPDDYTSLYQTICLDGVQYWTASRQLAPRFDPKTKQVKLCETNK
jgi:hypothetical protein